MSLISALLPARSESRSLINPADVTWLTLTGGGMFPIPTQTLNGGVAEDIGAGFKEVVDGAYKSGGVVAAVTLARILAVSQLRLMFQDVTDGRPGDFHDGPGLDLLRRPWPGGTTQNLLAKIEQHNSLAGNAFVVRRPNRLKVLRPDWMTIVRVSPDEVDDPLDANLAGYLYQEGGPMSGSRAVLLRPEEVSHYAPLPDPEAEYRGMSWLTPVIRQITSHKAAADHKWKFFSNGATPNMVIKFDPATAVEAVKAFRDVFLEEHAGFSNAYKTVFLGGGADVQPVGMDWQQLDFKSVQGADETLIAANGGVPPIIANLSEGLEASTYSNYGQAKRHFNDTTVMWLGGEAAASLETIVPAPAKQRLWVDTRDVPFFRDDAKAEADIRYRDAQTLRNYIDSGWDPESAKRAVLAGDISTMTHTGLFSVQLQKPGSPDVTVPSQAASALIADGWRIVAMTDDTDQET